MTSKTGYTPGPFGFYKDGDPLYPKHPWTITDTPNGGCDLAHAESEYIARYLAAAPEMVEALNRGLGILKPNSGKWTKAEQARSWAAWEQEARAILAKIEGE